MAITLNVRVDEDDYERWEANAKTARLSLSEWVRRKLNDLAEIRKPVDIRGSGFTKITKGEKPTITLPTPQGLDRTGDIIMPQVPPASLPQPAKAKFKPLCGCKNPVRCANLGPSCPVCIAGTSKGFGD
jgi:hypothetical protein